MRTPNRKWGEVLAARLLSTMAFFVVMSPTAGHAQFITDACIPANTVSPSALADLTMDPTVWAPGHTYTVSITGKYPVPDQETSCPNVYISAWEWPGYPDPFNTGAADPYVTLNNLTYVSPTLTTFTASVSAGTPTGHIFFDLSPLGSDYEYFWGALIQPPAPPNPPFPPSSPSCPVPTITGVTPSTWVAGKTYPITVTGTGFITAANATDSCPISVITVSVDTGTVTLTDVTVVNSTTITATVTPADTDPEEPAQVILWAPYNVLDDDDDFGADDDIMPQIAHDKPIANSIGGGIAPPGWLMVGQTAAKVLPLPIREVSTMSSNPVRSGYVGEEFKVRLFGKAPAIKFDGRTVYEQDPHEGTSNCNTTGLVEIEQKYFAHPGLAGGTNNGLGAWVVAGHTDGYLGNYDGQSNIYGDDGVVIPASYVSAIISRNPKGCTVKIIQNMLIDCGSDGTAEQCKYWTNNLILTITPIAKSDDYEGSVTVTRKGVASQ